MLDKQKVVDSLNGVAQKCFSQETSKRIIRREIECIVSRIEQGFYEVGSGVGEESVEDSERMNIMDKPWKCNDCGWRSWSTFKRCMECFKKNTCRYRPDPEKEV